ERAERVRLHIELAAFCRLTRGEGLLWQEGSRIRGRCQGAGGEGEAEVAKVLCVLYEDPVAGYPSSYAREAIPRIERYYDGQTTPTPKRIDFEPGELLGSVSGELGLRRFLETLCSRHLRSARFAALQTTLPSALGGFRRLLLSARRGGLLDDARG